MCRPQIVLKQTGSPKGNLLFSIIQQLLTSMKEKFYTEILPHQAIRMWWAKYEVVGSAIS